MDSNNKKPHVVHLVTHKPRKIRAIRKRTSSLGCEENEEKMKFEGQKNPQQSFSKPYRPLSASFGCQKVSDSGSQSDSENGQFRDHSSPTKSTHPRYGYQGYQSEGSPIPLHSVPRLLPPIGVFWDIENCQVPKGRSAVAVAQVIRKRFFTGYREAEFLVVCDVKKENNQILQELNDAQVNLIHVASMCKNAADEKLRQSMRRFADIHGSPASIVLISGDINFAADITDLRHRKKINVILLTKKNVSENLILCASEHYSFTDLVESLPLRGAIKPSVQPVEVLVYNLPADKESHSVKVRLRQLSDNCGGRVTSLRQTCATIQFSSFDVASRAQKRMDGEDVFGNKIQVSCPVRIAEKERWEGSPHKNFSISLGGKKYIGFQDKNTASSGMTDFLAPFPAGLYHSTPAALNMLSVGIRSGLAHPYVSHWSAFGAAGSTPITVTQDCYHGMYHGYHTPPVDIASGRDVRNQSPFPGGIWNSSYTPAQASKSPSNEGTKGMQIGASGPEKTPKGFRRIRGTHKGATDASVRSLKSRSPSLFVAPVGETSRVRRDTFGSRTSSKSTTPTPAPTPVQYDGDLDEPENFFQPINSSTSSQTNGVTTSEPVELHVSNLDQTIGAREMKKILLSAFKEHVTVLNMMVLSQPDGCLNALVRLPSPQDAQYAISKLQRRKIGHKRINISRASTSGPSPQIIRSQVLSLLQEVPNRSLPLFKFCELYESRFLCSISISDICRVKECQVIDGPRGRIVSLGADVRNSPSPQLPAVQEGEMFEQPFCSIHGHEEQSNRGWAEQEVLSLPSVKISLKLLAIRVHALLQTHNGRIHLSSLPQCYQAQFEPLTEDKDGVALEHLVSCLPGIEIFISPANIKYLRWSKSQSTSSVGSKSDEDVSKTLNTPLAGQLSVFSRELVDLLKTSPRCQVSFNKFIPAYHHHFGRQCRVADYGFTKLIELLDALPHIVQVLGDGNRRLVTLSHRVQLRRFMADLLRVLRSQPNKQVLLSQLSDAYEKVFTKALVITDYGVCDVRDLLSDLNDAPVVVTPVGDSEDDLLIVIPKREQTAEEKEKTKQFAEEVVELLRHVPNCSMRFNKFIPAHHIHFGWQCRVADYGFTKLIELFEAIPDIVQIDHIEGERWVTLTQPERLKVLADQIVSLVQAARDTALTEQALLTSYRLQFGYSLHPKSFGCSDFKELIALLSDTVKLEDTSSGPVIVLVDNKKKRSIQNILSSENDCSLDFESLRIRYKLLYNQSVTVEELKKMKDVEVTESNSKVTVRLGPLLRFSSEIHKLVLESGGRLPLALVESKYLERYERKCRPEQFGFTSLGALLQSLPGTIRLRGRGGRRCVILADSLSPSVGVTHTACDVTVIRSPKGDGDCFSNGDAESGHFSSTSGRDVDSSTSSDSKAHTTDRSSTSEMFSDFSGPLNSCDPVGHSKSTPATPGKGPWSHCIQSHLTVTNSPAVMLSPSSNLLPAFTSCEAAPVSLFPSREVATASPLPPLYAYPPFLSGHIESPEPSALPLPQLLAAPCTLPATLEAEPPSAGSGEGSSNSSTPCRTKVKRRLAAQFSTPLDLL